MKFNNVYQEFMESKDEEFFVEMGCLYSGRNKLEKVVDSINKKNYSHTRHKPVLVSKMGEGKYFIVDGNHRVMEYARDGKTKVKVKLFDYRKNILETEIEDDIVPVSEYVGKLTREIDEKRIPRSIPRFLYWGTYKQMFPTIKRGGGVKPGQFLARTYKEAVAEANMVEDIDPDYKDNIVVFKINTRKLNKDNFEVDNNEDPKEYFYNDVIPCDCLIRNG